MVKKGTFQQIGPSDTMGNIDTSHSICNHHAAVKTDTQTQKEAQKVGTVGGWTEKGRA